MKLKYSSLTSAEIRTVMLGLGHQDDGSYDINLKHVKLLDGYNIALRTPSKELTPFIVDGKLPIKVHVSGDSWVNVIDVDHSISDYRFLVGTIGLAIRYISPSAVLPIKCSKIHFGTQSEKPEIGVIHSTNSLTFNNGTIKKIDGEINSIYINGPGFPLELLANTGVSEVRLECRFVPSFEHYPMTGKFLTLFEPQSQPPDYILNVLMVDKIQIHNYNNMVLPAFWVDIIKNASKNPDPKSMIFDVAQEFMDAGYDGKCLELSA